MKEVNLASHTKYRICLYISVFHVLILNIIYNFTSKLILMNNYFLLLLFLMKLTSSGLVNQYRKNIPMIK